MGTVSVIIPTYKNRGGLCESINSVISQNYDNLIEIIIVDDNDPASESRATTSLLMQQYADNKLVKYICHDKNKNGAAARNTGIRASCGDYIAFLDDDDIFLSHKLKKQVRYLEEHPEKDAVYCFAKRAGRVVSTSAIEGNGTREILLLKSNYFTPSLMFRRQALEHINGFDETFRRHQDYELMLRFFAAGHEIGCVQEPLIEIGLNLGENIPTGEKLNQLKEYFFSKFDGFIKREDSITPGFQNRVYATHYAGVFLNHLKHKNFAMAKDVLLHYFMKSPNEFMKVILKSIIVHLKREA